MFCLGLFCTFVYVRMYVSLCNFSDLVCDLLPRRLFDDFVKGVLPKQYLSYNFDKQRLGGH